MFYDLFDGLMRRRLWTALAVEDIRSRYMRSFAGIGWVFISFALFVFVKVVIFTPLSNEDVTVFGPYVTIGYFVWYFLNASIVEGCNTFISAQNWIKGMRIPLSVFAFQTVARNSMLAAINLLVVFVIFAYTHTIPSLTALWIIPFCGILVLNSLWVAVVFGVFGARMRDFVHMVTTIMRVMMFLTPIFWVPDQMGQLWNFLKFNPLAHFLILIRDPLLYGVIPYDSLIVVLGVTVVGWVLAFAIMGYGYKRLVYWL